MKTDPHVRHTKRRIPSEKEHSNAIPWEVWLHRFLIPRLPLLAAIVVSATLLLILFFNGIITHPFVEYFTYLYSTYALVILCARVPAFLQFCRRRIEGFADRHPWLTPAYSLLRDYERRTQVMLVPSLLFNLLYAAFKLVAGWILQSFWLMGAGMYYAILSLVRFSGLYTYRRRLMQQGVSIDGIGGLPPDTQAQTLADWKVYRLIAICLFGLTFVIGWLITQIVVSGKAYHYPGSLIYAFALYAFIKIISAIRSLIRLQHGENRLLAASRCISFSCALVSILALQTALIDQFGDPQFGRIANSLLGLTIFLAMLALCTFMLWRAHKHLRGRC